MSTQRVDGFRKILASNSDYLPNSINCLAF